MQQHPQRLSLHNEVHARPPEPLQAPLGVSHWVMWLGDGDAEAARQHLHALLSAHHVPVDLTANHVRADMGAYRLRWEMHTEFVSITLMRPLDLSAWRSGAPLPTARDVAPVDWLNAMPGQCLCAMHVTALPQEAEDMAKGVRASLQAASLSGATVTEGQAMVLADFALQADGHTQALVVVRDLSPRRLGRLVQRLLEIETYRMAALMGLPVARDSAVWLTRGEAELAALAAAIRSASAEDESQLLDRLTRLAADVESQYARTHARFSASSAYFELVRQRISDLAEVRLEGMQSIKDFMDRRLSPAMNTCAWAMRRQQSLSERISRISNLLRTRVEIEQQESNQALLHTMNQRQGLQLKLQSTVEGLSVAAITYYMTGLVGYLAKGAKSMGWPLDPELSMAASVPVIALAMWWFLRRLHGKLDLH
jgi:uncharacterized membrane-anchored protein